MMTLVALIVTSFLVPQPASVVTMPVAVTWPSGAPAGLSLAVSGAASEASTRCRHYRASAVAPGRKWPCRDDRLRSAEFGSGGEDAAAERNPANGISYQSIEVNKPGGGTKHATASRVDKPLGSRLICR
jgi:hypothetical protein